MVRKNDVQACRLKGDERMLTDCGESGFERMELKQLKSGVGINSLAGALAVSLGVHHSISFLKGNRILIFTQKY